MKMMWADFALKRFQRNLLLEENIAKSCSTRFGQDTIIQQSAAMHLHLIEKPVGIFAKSTPGTPD